MQWRHQSTTNRETSLVLFTLPENIFHAHFSHGPSIWNSFPSTLRDSSLFKEQLKTYLFGMDNNEHHPALLERFVIVAPSPTLLGPIYYLLTYFYLHADCVRAIN